MNESESPRTAPSATALLHDFTANARKRLRTLEELMADPVLMAAPTAVLPQLAYVGRCTLLSAREKTGKSTLMAQAAVAVSKGGHFLGERVTPGRVLWYALDEPFKDAVQRFARFGADAKQIVLPEHRPTAAILDADCAEWRPTLVVIDTLSRLLFANGIDLMNGRAIEQFLQPLMNVIQARGAALVLLHHTNRKGEEYTGSIHLGAIVDGPLTLKTAGRTRSADDDELEEDVDVDDEYGRVIEGQTRWGAVRLVLRWSPKANGYVMYKRNEYLVERITSELARAPEGISGNALQKAIGLRREPILECLRQGEEDGRWFRKGNRWFPKPT